MAGAVTSERLFSHWPNLLASEGLVCGIDVGSSAVRYVLCDLDGNILTKGRTDMGLGRPNEVVDALFDHISSRLNALHRTPDSIVRIGVSFSGVVHPKSGKVLWSPPLPTWEHFDLKAAFEAWRTAVVVANNANAGAVGEVLFGAARDFRNAAYIHLGQGIGLGIFNEGRLYTGARGFAGEIGHMQVADGGRPCRCGGKNHLEGLAGSFLFSDTPLESQPGPEALQASVDAALRGIEPFAGRLRVLSGRLSEAITQLWLILAPDVVVIGSQSPTLNNLLAREASTLDQEWPFERAGVRKLVVPAAMPGESELYGALGLALLSLST